MPYDLRAATSGPVESDEEAYLRDVMGDDESVGPAEKVFAHEVQRELRRLRARDAAVRSLRAEQRQPIPPFVGLREFLDEPDDSTRYVIDQLFPVGARVLLSAQFKAGKSTLTGNLLRALADGTPFLGEHDVATPDGAIALIDDELDARTLRRWLREQGITNTDRIDLVSLRGRVSTFDLTDPDVLNQWADNLRARGASVVVLDCLRPILDSIGLDEKAEVGQFLVPFDELLARGGASEAAVVHHMGHTGERARGDSRLRDWPDVEWRLVRQDDDPSSPRFFTAYGRDVDLPERELGYDPVTRRLTIVGGSRKDADANAAIPAVLEAVRDAETPPSGRAIETTLGALEGEDRVLQKQGRAALAAAISRRLLRVEVVGRSHLHYLTEAGEQFLTDPHASMRQHASPVRQRTRGACVSASIDDAHTRTRSDDEHASADAPCTRCGHGAANVLGLCGSCAYPAGDAPAESEAS